MLFSQIEAIYKRAESPFLFSTVWRWNKSHKEPQKGKSRIRVCQSSLTRTFPTFLLTQKPSHCGSIAVYSRSCFSLLSCLKMQRVVNSWIDAFTNFFLWHSEIAAAQRLNVWTHPTNAWYPCAALHAACLLDEFSGHLHLFVFICRLDVFQCGRRKLRAVLWSFKQRSLGSHFLPRTWWCIRRGREEEEKRGETGA